MTKKGPSRGNALFLILIAVALFAALSYAITQSSRGGGGGTQKEADMITAAQILQIGAAVRATVQRMTVGGVAAANIKLHSNVLPYETCNDTDGTCVFDPSGGGMTWPQKPAAAYDDVNAGYLGFFEMGELTRGTSLPDISIGDVGTTGPESILVLAPLKKSVCEALNKLLNIPSIPVQDDTFDDAGATHIIFTLGAGHRAACINIGIIYNEPEAYYFYYVLSES